MTLIWKGDELKEKVKKAERLGVDATMGEAAERAKNNHEWTYRKGTLERSIGIITRAVRLGQRFRGEWGSKNVVYALIHELGGRIVPKRANFLRFQVSGKWVTVSEVNIPARPYLRPAAAVTYPRLAVNIAETLRFL